MNILRISFSVLFFCLITVGVFSQKIFTKSGTVRFESEAPLERIEAVNDNATCVWDTETGAIQIAILIKSFHFEKALMQEHFNENYMDSNTYPKAVFKGKVTNMDAIDLKSDGTYTANIAGTMDMHGVTQPVETEATITVSGDDINGTTAFELAVADYDIEIPKLVADKVAKIVSIEADFDFKPLER